MLGPEAARRESFGFRPISGWCSSNQPTGCISIELSPSPGWKFDAEYLGPLTSLEEVWCAISLRIAPNFPNGPSKPLALGQFMRVALREFKEWS